MKLRSVGKLVATSATCEQARHVAKDSEVMWTPEMVDLWGKPIEPPKTFVP